MIHPADSKSVTDIGTHDIETAATQTDECLSDPHCRFVLEYLQEQDGSASLSTVAAYVVSQITGENPADVSETVQRRVQTWLHHGQLPTLDERGLVDFHPESGTVTLTDPPSDPVRPIDR